MKGAIRYIYKFPIKHAFAKQSTHVPGITMDPQRHLINIEKHVNVSRIQEIYCLKENNKYEYDEWLHTTHLFNKYGRDIETKWPLYLALIAGEEYWLYILHPDDNEKIKAWIDGRDCTSIKLDELVDELKWNPKFGSKVAEMRIEFNTIKKRKTDLE